MRFSVNHRYEWWEILDTENENIQVAVFGTQDSDEPSPLPAETLAKALAFALNAFAADKPLVYIDYWANDGSHPDLVHYEGPGLDGRS